MKTINLILLFSLLALTACQEEVAIPASPSQAPAVWDISISEAVLQPVEVGLVALNLDISIVPGAEAPWGSFTVRAYEGNRLLHTFDASLAGIPSGKCCQQGKCEEVENMTYTCDARCDNNSRQDGCNYHLQKQVFLPLDAGAAIRLVLDEEKAILETGDGARNNNSLSLTVPGLQEIPQPGNPNNPYDEVGRWHNEQLQALLQRTGSDPAFADMPAEGQQRAILEWAVEEAMAIDESAAAFNMPRFLRAYSGGEDRLMREANLEDFKVALERLDLSGDSRQQLAALFQLLLEHPLEGRADIEHLLGAIRHLEAGWIEGQDATQAEAPLIAASVARYSLCFWAARQPAPFQGPQLFGIREAFFADAFGGGIGAALGAIGGPGGAVIGGLIGGVASSAVFAID